MPDLLKRLLTYARKPRSGEEIAAVIEDWVAARPTRWTRVSSSSSAEPSGAHFPLVKLGARARRRRVGHQGAPAGAPKGEKALDEVVRGLRHLRRAPSDVAGWIGWRTPPVRAALERPSRRAGALRGRPGPRALRPARRAASPTPRRPRPPRLLAAFDSVLLAYASKRRQRILPDAHRDAVYERRNLQIRPSYLVDGLVAGTWSTEVKRREATLTLRPLERLPRATAHRADEAERLVRNCSLRQRPTRVVVAR